MNKKFCQKCGKQIDSNAEFCPYCGAQQSQSNNTYDNIQSPNNSNMITAFKHNWDNAFFISGRTSRADYWFNYLDLVIIGILSYMILGISGNSESIILLYSIVSAFMAVINFTSAVRRLHDTDKSGHFLWMIFIPFVGPIILIVLLAMPSNQSNRFNVTKDSNNIWYKNWWSWLIIAVLAFMYFGMINGVNAAENSLKQQIEDSEYNGSNDSSTDEDTDYNESYNDDSKSSSSNSNEENSKQSDSDSGATNGHQLSDFNIGPLKFTKVFSGIMNDNNISSDLSDELFDDFGGDAPSEFFKEGSSYKQILIKYKVKNTGQQSINFSGLMDNNDLLMPDGTQLSQLESKEFYSGEKPNSDEIKPGATVNGHLLIQLKDENKNKIPSGTYQFKTGYADDSEYNRVADPIEIKFNPYK
ncbi:DUF805 domain-containing protein [Apilactobacillus micheneri]|uniref:DUF805 domain-containing protein n=1 Tax=Apilactobacillus micheneri TaxID=1899430 RepID=UPI000D52157B|nr:DUF805 domain-containing protein [Apilactobacillus micheneri]GAY79860.1 inner membrane protein YhaI [Apilactobacillus micheneri]